MCTHIRADMKLSKLLSQCCVKAFPSNPKYRKKWVIVWTHTPKGLWNTLTRVSAKTCKTSVAEKYAQLTVAIQCH